MAVSRTINPIHFEDLEPKRFEDLVRQLLYDFRNWRALEPTGRAGSDDGFDARGFEIVADDIERPFDEGEEVELPPERMDRQWLIQCKREKQISPSSLIKHLEKIAEAELTNLYGIVFVAACDFSKKSRDTFRTWCAEH